MLLDGMASIDIKQAPTLTVKNTQCVDTHLAIKQSVFFLTSKFPIVSV